MRADIIRRIKEECETLSRAYHIKGTGLAYTIAPLGLGSQVGHQHRAYEWPACCGDEVMLSAYCPKTSWRSSIWTLFVVLRFRTRFAGRAAALARCRKNGRFLYALGQGRMRGDGQALAERIREDRKRFFWHDTPSRPRPIA